MRGLELLQMPRSDPAAGAIHMSAATGMPQAQPVHGTSRAPAVPRLLDAPQVMSSMKSAFCHIDMVFTCFRPQTSVLCMLRYDAAVSMRSFSTLIKPLPGSTKLITPSFDTVPYACGATGARCMDAATGVDDADCVCTQQLRCVAGLSAPALGPLQ